MTRHESAGALQVLRAAVAPFLLLITPFVGYVQYQERGFGNPEVLVFTLAMAALALLLGAGSAWSPVFSTITLAALITFFADIQAWEPGLKRLGVLFLASCAVLWIIRRHAHRIVGLATATLLVLAVLTPPSGAVTSARADAPAAVPSRSTDRPLILHLLLDEFIGLEGLPKDLAPEGFTEERRNFFVDRGFRVFGKAYSEYPITLWSVPQLLNLAPGRFDPDLTAPGPSAGTYKLRRNAYFERLASLGYAIKVHEPDYLYLCPDGLAASCRTYASRSLGVLDTLDLSLNDKLSVVAGTYLGQSEAYLRLKGRYGRTRRSLAGTISLPAWKWDQGVPAPAGTMPIFEAVEADLASAQRGTFVFAHILMPHYPYIYDAECRQRPEKEWLLRNDSERADITHGVMNVPEGRAERYASYMQQMICTERKIDGLMAAIPASLREDAVIIVQGDHGSRITMLDPTTRARGTHAVSDYADAFSTMFAVRANGIEAGYDVRMSPITCLLRTLTNADFRSTDGLETCSSPNTVYFTAGGKPPSPRTLPDFSQPAAAQPVSTSGSRPAPVPGS
jgi:hypothetical protein